MENPASTKITVNNHHSAVKPPCLHLPQPHDAPATLNSKTCSEVAVNHEAPPRLHEPAIQNPKKHFVVRSLAPPSFTNAEPQIEPEAKTQNPNHYTPSRTNVIAANKASGHRRHRRRSSVSLFLF
ncbi:hypothetical protein V8G54_023451 [Vigna mungo]|uniref:Uncharacterized protein n=1 Tax=Vigna mungo TaxID=3915 RepID=A0AAQ3N4S3_VIGMU